MHALQIYAFKTRNEDGKFSFTLADTWLSFT